jgi:hypothetical protein
MDSFSEVGVKSAVLRAAYAIQPEGDILLILNLEDTPENLAPFAIERSRGVIPYISRSYSVGHFTLSLIGSARAARVAFS